METNMGICSPGSLFFFFFWFNFCWNERNIMFLDQLPAVWDFAAFWAGRYWNIYSLTLSSTEFGGPQTQTMNVFNRLLVSVCPARTK